MLSSIPVTMQTVAGSDWLWFTSCKPLGEWHNAANLSSASSRGLLLHWTEVRAHHHHHHRLGTRK